MDHLAKLPLLDESGRPLDARIQSALASLKRRFAREFEQIRDEAVIASIFESAGRSIEKREERNGPIERLYGFAWVVLKNAALSHLRSPSGRIEALSAFGPNGIRLLEDRHAIRGSPEQIEREVQE